MVIFRSAMYPTTTCELWGSKGSASITPKSISTSRGTSEDRLALDIRQKRFQIAKCGVVDEDPAHQPKLAEHNASFAKAPCYISHWQASIQHLLALLC